jgi:exocyst complex component 5
VFLVRPEILKSYITENYLGRIDSSLLTPYLAQRSDWGYVEKGFTDGLNMGEGGGTDNKGLRERLGMGRLSVMMKELEGLGENISMPALPSGLAGNFSIPGRGSGHS